MKQRGKVLVIEDKSIWQQKLKEYLEEIGFFVETVSSLEVGLDKIQKELFHFVTIDLQLDDDTADPTSYEGWRVLERIAKLRADQYLSTMVITAFEKDYEELKRVKKLEGTFFMSKKSFDKKSFQDLVLRVVEQTNLKFRDDHREA